MNKESLYTENEITINAPAERVWNALINSEYTRQYMFGCNVQSDWKIGAPVLWIGAADGITYVKGNLLEFIPNEKFSFSIFDPNGPYSDIPENYLVATYTLSHQNEGTHLKVVQGDYAKVEGGDQRYNDSMAAGGWQGVIEKIKEILERDEG